MPTLALKGTFDFYEKAKLSKEHEMWKANETAINIIINVLKAKLAKPGKNNRLYFLKGRTGSGKSTLMISSLYESIIRGSGGKLMCSEPRVVLTKANATDVVRYNKTYSFGKQMGVLSGAEKIICSERECMYYCTPQILNDLLLSIIQLDDKEAILHRLSAIKLVVVDEVHVLDTPMMALLKTIKDTVDKFSELNECPLFIFASATINIEQMVGYFFPDDESIYEQPLMIGSVAGSSNFSVNEEFLTDSQIAEYNEREKREGRNSCYKIMAEHFYNNYYKTLDESKSYVLAPNKDKIQCRDVLFFVPLVAGIDTIGDTLKQLITDRPVFLIKKGTEMKEVVAWRNENKGKKRVLYVGFGRGYAPASDELLAKPMETDIDSLHNEIRIVAATPVIETGKTIVTLYLCIDMGLNTTSVYNPLTYDVNHSILYLKQIPANVNQTIQRMGRVGREAPGNYLHFYSKDIMSHFQLSDTAETINSACLSGLLLTHLKGFKLNTTFDLLNENHYLYPTTTDILVKSAVDLINAGYLTIYGQLVCLRTSFEYADGWILYARYLYYVLGYPLWDALLIASLNRKALPPVFSVFNVDPTSLRYQLDTVLASEPNEEVIEGIQKARNVLTKIMHGKDRTFSYIDGKVYGVIHVAGSGDDRNRRDNRHGDNRGNGNGNGKPWDRNRHGDNRGNGKPWDRNKGNNRGDNRGNGKPWDRDKPRHEDNRDNNRGNGKLWDRDKPRHGDNRNNGKPWDRDKPRHGDNRNNGKPDRPRYHNLIEL